MLVLNGAGVGRAAAVARPIASLRIVERMARRAIIVCLLTRLWAAAALAQQPAVLVVSPQNGVAGWVDLDYLGELHSAGFEVDYTEQHGRVHLGSHPHVQRARHLCVSRRRRRRRLAVQRQAADLAGRLHRAGRALPRSTGGGVLLLATETQIRVTLTRELITPLGRRSAARAHRRPAEHRHDEPHADRAAHLHERGRGLAGQRRRARHLVPDPAALQQRRTPPRCRSTATGRWSCAPCRARGPSRST